MDYSHDTAVKKIRTRNDAHGKHLLHTLRFLQFGQWQRRHSQSPSCGLYLPLFPVFLTGGSIFKTNWSEEFRKNYLMKYGY
jgi:hypothetical protein